MGHFSPYTHNSKPYQTISLPKEHCSHQDSLSVYECFRSHDELPPGNSWPPAGSYIADDMGSRNSRNFTCDDIASNSLLVSP